MTDILIDKRQSRMARAALDWSLPELANAAGLGLNTVTRFEKGSGARVDTLRKLVATYRRHGVEFKPDGSVLPPPEPVQQSAA